MCGIVGFWATKGGGTDCEKSAVAMANAIRHRGPDDGGAWSDGSGIFLAHRRLSILDLSPGGHQPMASHSGRFTIAYNGEIYNFQALRRELEAQCEYKWRGHSDTEVMLAAIEAWGFDMALKRFEGMFAFALWDREQKSLHLARDRMGEKPLYYGWQGDTFVFASELSALMAHPATERCISKQALGQFLKFSYVPAPLSIFEGIFKLLPGTSLCLSSKDLLQKLSPSLVPYWSLKASVDAGICRPFQGTFEEATDRLETLALDAVNKQMQADVPVGAFLSGGVDSSAIVALMQKRRDAPVKTFSIGFDNTAYNEAEDAAAVARHLGTDHTEVYVSEADVLHQVPAMASVFSEPFADASQMPTSLICSVARKSVTVCLSGDAGDEIFGGYNRYTKAPGIYHQMQSVPGFMRKSIAWGLDRMSPFATGMANGINPLLPKEHQVRLLGDKMRKLSCSLSANSSAEFYESLVSFWAPETIVPGYRAAPSAGWPPSFEGMGFAPWMMAMDGATYLPDDILVKVDRAAMAVGLESRVPFLDPQIVEFAWSLPIEYKVGCGQSKRILRSLLDRYVPRKLIERPKMGFSAPIDIWLRGALKDWAGDLLSEDRLRRQELVDADVVKTVWKDHQSMHSNNQFFLWPILMLQAWLDENDLG